MIVNQCVGPGRTVNEIKCVHGNWKSDKNRTTDLHKIEQNVDTLPYNGIRNWRCPICFEEHRKLLRKK